MKKKFTKVCRNLIRHLVLSGLSGVYKATGQHSWLDRNRIHFLLIHQIFKEEESNFRKLLNILGQTHSFISYSEAVNRILSGPIDKPYIALSFDDGLKSCFGAVRILNEFGIKACFFICPTIVGENDPDKKRDFCMNRLHTSVKEFLNWSDVETLLNEGHEIGSHTMRHRDLAQLEPSEVEDEIVESFNCLRKRIGKVQHFAWPFGRFSNISMDGIKTVFRTGFKSCASSERGCHVTFPTNMLNLCIRRDPFEVEWPLSHILYFLSRSSQTASLKTNAWPENWNDALRRINL